jgi:hypothetical protein
VVVYVILGQNSSTHEGGLPLVVAFMPFALSMIVRWGILPRINDARKALPAFLVGLAMAESSCYFGLFLFPLHKLPLFGLALLGLAQLCPVFALRYYEDGPAA